MFKDLVMRNRSYRRFYQNEPVAEETLKELVDLTRFSPSGINRQALRYVLCCDPEMNEQIFPLISFAPQFKDWDGPSEGDRPTAYIIILLDTEISKRTGCDHGISAQTILLGATEKGLGGCMHDSVKKPELMSVLNIPEKYQILLVVSLGKPKEKVVLETGSADNKISYWRDHEQTHHVPKRSLDEIIIE